MTWPRRVRALRRHLGLTQEQLAHRLGCTVNAVARWERGVRTPTGLYAQAVENLERSSRAG